MHEENCACCTKGVDAARANADAMIRDHGFMFQAVFGSDESRAFVYTIGLAERGLPEFIFVGSSSPQAAGYLGAAIDAAMAGAQINPGMVDPETALNPFGVPLWILEADDKLETHAFGVTARLERVGKDATPRLLQVVMPDLNGIFPWEPDYNWLEQDVDKPPVTGRA